VRVVVQGQVRLRDVALRGGLSALLPRRGAGRLGQAGGVGLQCGEERGTPLALLGGRRGVSGVPQHGGVGEEGTRLGGHRRELAAASPGGAGVRDGGDGAFAQGARSLQRTETRWGIQGRRAASRSRSHPP